jgi:DNA excision repair protein ERCC-4
LVSDVPMSLEDDGLVLLDFGSETLESDFDNNYGLLKPEETVLIRAYSDDTDDRMLIEIKPKFIVMFEPDMDFVRRVEVRPSLVLFAEKDRWGLQRYGYTGLQKL